MIKFLIPRVEEMHRKEALIWLNRTDGYRWIFKIRISEDPESKFYNTFDIKEILSINKVLTEERVCVAYQSSSALDIKHSFVKISDIYLENPKRNIVLRLKSLNQECFKVHTPQIIIIQ